MRQQRHQFLPTNKCHLYGEPEITEHLFLCKQRGEWKQSFLANIDKELRRLETAADIRRHIVQGLEDWLFTKAIELISVDQDAIGWYNIVRGYIALHWGTFQEKFYRQNHHDERYYTGSIWATALIHFIWQQGHKLWTQRRTEVHKANSESNPQNHHRQATETRVKAMYSMAMHVNANDRVIFDKPLEERLTMRTRTLKNWVKTYTPALRQAICEAKEQQKTGHQDKRT